VAYNPSTQTTEQTTTDSSSDNISTTLIFLGVALCAAVVFAAYQKGKASEASQPETQEMPDMYTNKIAHLDGQQAQDFGFEQ